MSNYQHLFDESYDRVVGQGVGVTSEGKQFFRRFYEYFFERSDEIKSKFKDTDMESQVRILQKSMYHMIGVYVLKTEHEYLRRIAVTHNRSNYDIKPEYYDHWIEAMVSTVRELDPQFDREIELAWRIAVTPGILYMKMHYEDTEEDDDRVIRPERPGAL